jgi:hypothetical protein
LGYQTTDTELAECYRQAITLADSAKQVTDRDLLSIIHKIRRGREISVVNQDNGIAAAS